MLTGSYTPPKILDIANKEWGFRTRKFKRIGGNELSKSGIYRIFTNLFYAGIAKNKGVQYEGKHERMITLEEYDRVQILLFRKNKRSLFLRGLFGVAYAAVFIPPRPKRS